MPQSYPGSSNPFDVTRQTDAADGPREPVRARRMAIPLRLDDGTIRTVDVPAALQHPSQFSAGELERLTRAYAEALGLLKSEA